MSIFQPIKYRTKHTELWQIAIMGLFLFNTSLHSSTAQTQVTTPSPKQYVRSISYVPNSVDHLILGQPLVEVMLNGTTTATFLVDTGSPVSVISQSLARKLGGALSPAVDDRGRAILYNGAKEQSMMTKVSEISIGQLAFNDRLMLVAEEKSFMLHPGIPYDGVIGMSLLRSAALLLDTQRHTLTFCYPGTVGASTLAQLGFTAPCVLPLTEDEGAQWVQARFSDHGNSGEERLMLDTGATQTHVSKQLAKQLDLTTISQQKQRGLFGDSVVDVVKIGEVRLGDLTVRNFPVAAITQPMLTKTLAAPSLLGLDILSGYRVLMDFPGGKLYLQPYPSTIPAITIGPAPTPPATATPPAK